MGIKENTIDVYNKNALFFSEKFKTLMDLNKRSEFPRFIELLGGKKILDLGCGSGDHSKYFLENGLDVSAIDLSEEMVLLAREKGVSAEVMDIENLLFENNSFDGIWATTSLLHIPKDNLKKVFAKLNSILNDNGILYVCVKEGGGELVLEDGRFFSFWKMKEFVELASDYFKIIESGRINLEGRTFLKMFFKKKIKLS